MQPLDREPMKAGGTQEGFLEEEKPELSYCHSSICSFPHSHIQHTFIEGDAKHSIMFLYHGNGCYCLISHHG